MLLSIERSRCNEPVGRNGSHRLCLYLFVDLHDVTRGLVRDERYLETRLLLATACHAGYSFKYRHETVAMAIVIQGSADAMWPLALPFYYHVRTEPLH